MYKVFNVVNYQEQFQHSIPDYVGIHFKLMLCMRLFLLCVSWWQCHFNSRNMANSNYLGKLNRIHKKSIINLKFSLKTLAIRINFRFYDMILNYKFWFSHFSSEYPLLCFNKTFSAISALHNVVHNFSILVLSAFDIGKMLWGQVCAFFYCLVASFVSIS